MSRLNSILLALMLCNIMVLGLYTGKIYGQDFKPAITVALDGSGNFTKIQDAINAAPDNSTSATIIFIRRGLYNTEKLIVPASKTNLVLIGESRDETIISYHIYDCQTGGYGNKCPSEDAKKWSDDNIRTSATLTIMADDFQAENLTIQNTAGPVGQALAITVRSDRVVFRNCNFSSYQDTIYLWSNALRSYFENCLVVGRTDYIYGSGTAFFQNCEIRSWGGGWITAPSTAKEQPYGFVFNQCQLTYAWNSPRTGDDGASFALGRPWHNYPKVAWLFCEMSEKLNPLGWPDKWNMPYSDTSLDLHLYEYKNYGPGAAMSGRAKWAGLRALNDDEAINYTSSKVLSGVDGWNPASEKPKVTTFAWSAIEDTATWMNPANWTPKGIPGINQAAFVNVPFTVNANGGTFLADLTLSKGAVLSITSSSKANYLAIGGSVIKAPENVRLDGHLRTKDSIAIEVGEKLDFNATISGIHPVTKKGKGTLQLNSDNSGFSGYWNIAQGRLAAARANALGKAKGIIIDSLAILLIEKGNAIFIETPLRIRSGGMLELYADILLSEFYLGDSLQLPGKYDASKLSGLLSGTGSITIGRPSSFIFKGGANGNWDNPAHFQPGLLPVAGETVYTNIEMETTPYVFPADIVVQAGGRIRLRGDHRATGTITLEQGTSLYYATSGAGFMLAAPINVKGDVIFAMNSRAVPQHYMHLNGPLSGNSKITISNQRADIKNSAVVVLGGDNIGFGGTWDLTIAAAHPESSAALQGISTNSFGKGKIEVGLQNRLILSHPRCVGNELQVNLFQNGLIQLDTTVIVGKAVINGVSLSAGAYDANNKPEFFTGKGKLKVDTGTGLKESIRQSGLYAAGNQLFFKEPVTSFLIFDIVGRHIDANSQFGIICLEDLPPGLYVVQYIHKGKRQVEKVLVF
jgi:pectin methylesterase-like acyl-CoA thioesterase